MAKRKSTRKPTRAMVAAQARIATQEELIGQLHEAINTHQQKDYKQQHEIAMLRIKPTQIRRVVRMIEYVGDPVEIASTLAMSMPIGVSDRNKMMLTVTQTEDVTRDVVVRAERQR